MDILKQPKAALLLILITLAACSGSSVGFQSAVSGGNTVDSNMPVFEHRLDTDHFVLKWTNRSSHTADNISDPAVVKETSITSNPWGKYTNCSAEACIPLPKIGSSVFRDIDCDGGTPRRPIIQGPAGENPAFGSRSAHELFQKMHSPTCINGMESEKALPLGYEARRLPSVCLEGQPHLQVDSFQGHQLDLYEADEGHALWIILSEIVRNPTTSSWQLSKNARN